jgi:hypothetical protein
LSIGLAWSTTVGVRAIRTRLSPSVKQPVLPARRNAGRLDLAVRFNGQIYLFEFKVVELTPDGRALQQLKDKDYAARYRGEDRPIHLIGVEFSRERRTVVGFEVEQVPAPGPQGR